MATATKLRHFIVGQYTAIPEGEDNSTPNIGFMEEYPPWVVLCFENQRVPTLIPAKAGIS